jgi:hypothetical protein
MLSRIYTDTFAILARNLIENALKLGPTGASRRRRRPRAGRVSPMPEPAAPPAAGTRVRIKLNLCTARA